MSTPSRAFVFVRREFLEVFESEDNILSECFNKTRSILSEIESCYFVFNDNFIVKNDSTRSIKDSVSKSIKTVQTDLYTVLEAVGSLLERVDEYATKYYK